MPYSRPFLQVTCEGFFGSTEAAKLEDWRAGFKISTLGGGDVTPPSLLTFLNAIATDVSTYHSSANVKAGTDTKLKSLAMAYIGTDGRYVLGGLQPTTRYTYATPVGGSGAPLNPYSTACCITLRSLVNRGPASHGRIYWPATGLPIISGQGVIGSSAQTAIAGNAKTLLNAVNAKATTQFGAGSNVSLCSQVGSGREAVVTSVGIGNRLDSMESREKKLPEAHVFQTLTVSTLLQADRDEDLADRYDEYQRGLEGV